MWCIVSSSTCSRGPQRGRGVARSSGPAARSNGRPASRASQPARLRLALRLRERGEVDDRQRRRTARLAIVRARVARRDRGRSCAAPRGGARSPEARARARRRRAARGGGSARQSCRRALRLELVEEPQPLLGEGERPACSAGGAHDRRAPGGRPAPRAGARSRPASPATVGASKIARSGDSTPRLSRTRETIWVASSEWPPRSKKSSWTPTSLDAQESRPGRRRSRARSRPRGLVGRSPARAGRAARARAAAGGDCAVRVARRRRSFTSSDRCAPAGPRSRPRPGWIGRALRIRSRAAMPSAGVRAQRAERPLRQPGGSSGPPACHASQAMLVQARSPACRFRWRARPGTGWPPRRRPCPRPPSTDDSEDIRTTKSGSRCRGAAPRALTAPAALLRNCSRHSSRPSSTSGANVRPRVIPAAWITPSMRRNAPPPPRTPRASVGSATSALRPAPPRRRPRARSRGADPPAGRRRRRRGPRPGVPLRSRGGQAAASHQDQPRAWLRPRQVLGDRRDRSRPGRRSPGTCRLRADASRSGPGREPHRLEPLRPSVDPGAAPPPLPLVRQALFGEQIEALRRRARRCPGEPRPRRRLSLGSSCGATCDGEDAETLRADRLPSPLTSWRRLETSTSRTGVARGPAPERLHQEEGAQEAPLLLAREPLAAARRRPAS